LRDRADSERFDRSLAMYLIVRDLMAELNAVGGGFMSRLEWGWDVRGTPPPVADVMESLLNSAFDHNGPKPPCLRHPARRPGAGDDAGADLAIRGFVDGNNSGPASLDRVGRPGASLSECMKAVSMPLADEPYFPGGGNSVTFIAPGGIEGIAASVSGISDGNCPMACGRVGKKRAPLPIRSVEPPSTARRPTWSATGYRRWVRG